MNHIKKTTIKYTYSLQKTAKFQTQATPTTFTNTCKTRRTVNTVHDGTLRFKKEIVRDFEKQIPCNPNEDKKNYNSFIIKVSHSNRRLKKYVLLFCSNNRSKKNIPIFSIRNVLGIISNHLSFFKSLQIILKLIM